MRTSFMHAVWPTPVFDYWSLWDDDAKRRAEDRYRPAGYTGGRHDVGAWAAYRAACERDELQRWRHRFNNGGE